MYVCQSVSIFSFLDNNLSKCQKISPDLVYALWRSGLGLLMGKFRQFLTELSALLIIMVGYYLFRAQLFKANDVVS